jgi:CelD/BcsL family acetyltransferase involved in cellulose biosynthesis
MDWIKRARIHRISSISMVRRLQMRVTEIGKFSDFLALQQEWTEILQLNNQTIFQTWEWLSTWWKHFGKGRRLLILLAKENGEIKGIAPLMYSVYSKFGIRQGVIEFIGCQHSGYNDFILTTNQEECIKIFLDYLNNISENWTYASLSDIPENKKSADILRKLGKVRPAHQSFYALLPSSNDKLLEWINRKDRKEIRRNLRRLEEAGFKPNLVDYSDIGSTENGLKNLITLHQERWKIKGGFSGMFADPRFKNFIQEIVNCFSQKGWLGLYSYELSGKPVGSLCGFKFNSKFYAYIEGLDSKYLKYSIGNLLFVNTMTKCIADSIVEFDFLWGTDLYKKKFNPIPKRTDNAIIIKNSSLVALRFSLFRKYYNGGILLENRLGKLKNNLKSGISR